MLIYVFLFLLNSNFCTKSLLKFSYNSVILSKDYYFPVKLALI